MVVAVAAAVLAAGAARTEVVVAGLRWLAAPVPCGVVAVDTNGVCRVAFKVADWGVHAPHEARHSPMSHCDPHLKRQQNIAVHASAKPHHSVVVVRLFTCRAWMTF